MTDIHNSSIGYRRPPKHTQFKKGISGNPRGRPKGTNSVLALLEKALHRRVTITVGSRPKSVSAISAILLQLTSRALRGEHQALKIVLQLSQAAESARKTRQDNKQLVVVLKGHDALL
jgi:hypothetical protein